MIFTWFTGIPQNGTGLGTTVNFADFGRPAGAPTTAPTMAATIAGAGSLTGNLDALTMAGLLSGHGSLSGTLSGGTPVAQTGANPILYGVTIDTMRSPSGNPIVHPVRIG